MSEDRDPLDGLFEEAPEPQVTEPKDDAPAQEAPVAKETPAEEAAPAPEEANPKIEPEPKMVPLAALEEARTRARDAEARLADASKPKETPAEAPAPRSFDDDPAGAMQDFLGQVELNNVNLALNTSRRFAAKEHGQELVDTVQAWALEKFDKDAAYAAKVIYAEDPYELAIADYKAEQALNAAKDLDPEILKGLDAEELALLKAHRAGKNTAGTPQVGESIALQDTQPRAENGEFKSRRQVDAPPKSILDAPNGGKGNLDVASGEGVAFDAAFTR